MDRYSALASRIPAFAGLIDDGARRQVDWIEQLAADGPLRVLDAGCGGGRHSALLAARGHRVTGLDASAPALQVAREQAQKLGVDVDWRQGDLRSPPPGPYDLVLLMDVTLGVFTDEQSLDVLRTLRATMAPKATIIIELYHLPFWRTRLGTSMWPAGAVHPELAVERTYREEPGHLIDEVTLITSDGGREAMPTQRLRALSVEEGVALVAASGLKPSGLVGPKGFEYTGTPAFLPHDAAFAWIIAKR